MSGSEIREELQRRGWTLAEFARRIGVSRPTAYRLLLRGTDQVRRETMRRLDEALGGSGPGKSRECLVRAYLTRLRDACSTVPWIDSATSGSGTRLPLDHVFVSPRFAPLHEHQHRHEESGTPSSVSLEELLDRDRCIWMTGEAGSGKTTVLNYLAWVHASGIAGSDGSTSRRLVPILVSLVRWEAERLARPGLALEAWLAEQVCRFGGPSADGGGSLPDLGVPYLILLDGLDDLSTARRPQAVAEIRALSMARASDRFVVSARSLERAPEGESRDVGGWRILPFGKTERRRLLLTLAQVLLREDRAERDAQRMVDAIESAEELRSLARTPLLLVLLAKMYARSRSFPSKRADLYERLLDDLMGGWDGWRIVGAASDSEGALGIGVREVRRILEDWALHLREDRGIAFTRGRWSAFAVEALRKLGLAPTAADLWAEHLLDLLARRSAILQETTGGIVEFGHADLQDYLAGCALARRGDRQGVLRERPYDPDRRAMIGVALGRLEPEEATWFLRTILDDPDPLGRWLHRGEVLALKWLADDPPVYDATLFDELFARLSKWTREAQPGLYHAFEEPLAKMQGTRFHGRVRRLLLDTSLDTEVMPVALQTSTAALVRWLESEPDLLMQWMALAGPAPAKVQARIRRLCASSVLQDPSRLERIRAFMRASRDAALSRWGVPIVDFLAEDTSASRRALLHLLRERQEARCEVISVLSEGGADPETESELKRVAVQDPKDHLRARAISALGSLRKRWGESYEFVLSRAREDRSQEVRVEAIAALARVASHDQVTPTLRQLAEKDRSPRIRAAALEALENVVRRDAHLRDRVFDWMERDRAPRVRAAAARVLGGVETDRILCVMNRETDPFVKATAASRVAMALAYGQRAWDDDIAREVEGLIRAEGVDCPHCWGILWALCEGREVWGSPLSSVQVLAAALSPWLDRVQTAFVFGSTARGEARSYSDIDLFIVGEVQLSEIATAIRSTQDRLGRPVNPVIRTRGELRKLFEEGSAFIHEVMRKPKRFVKGSERVLADMVGERVARTT